MIYIIIDVNKNEWTDFTNVSTELNLKFKLK